MSPTVYRIHFTLMLGHGYPVPRVTAQKNLLPVGTEPGTTRSEGRLTNHLASRTGGKCFCPSLSVFYTIFRDVHVVDVWDELFEPWEYVQVGDAVQPCVPDHHQYVHIHVGDRVRPLETLLPLRAVDRPRNSHPTRLSMLTSSCHQFRLSTGLHRRS